MKLTRRGEIVFGTLAFIIFLLFMMIVGGIEKGTL